MANPHLPNHYVNGVIVHQFTTQDGTTKAIIRMDTGQHTDPQPMPFSTESYEGRRVRLVDGVWRLTARVTA